MGKNNREIKVNTKINEQITSKEVRLIGDNVEQKIYTLNEALQLSNELGLDLIEISSNAKPPVCKIQDFNKFLYEMKRKKKEMEKKQQENKVELKEIRFTPNIDNHDYEFKKRYIEKFLKNGDRVRVFVQFKGREIQYKEKGEIILLKLADELSNISSVNKLPVLEGYKMVMLLNSTVNKK